LATLNIHHIDNISASALHLSFNLDIEQTGGRVAVINGDWIFVMMPK